MWIVLSLCSALFSGTAWVLSKGASSADARGAIAVRSISLLGFCLGFVGLTGSFKEFTAVDNTALWSSVGAGVTAAIALICFQKLIANGLGRGAVLEKLSILVIAFAEWIWFGCRWTGWGVAALGLIAVGIFLMSVDKSNAIDTKGSRGNMMYTLGTVGFTSASTLLAKLAVGAVSPAIALSLRTGVAMLTVVIWLCLTGSLSCIRKIPGNQRWYLTASGVSAGIAWLCYFFALTMGDASVVHGIDKLSVLVTTASGRLFYRERYSRHKLLGIAVMVIGIVIWSFSS